LGEAEDRIAQNVNTDEAAVLGAAYYGASLSRQFKMKNLNVTERSLEEFVLQDPYEVVFATGANLGTKQTLSFVPADEMVWEFSQGE